MIVDRSRILIPHGVTAEQWSERYNLEPFTHPCSGCGVERTTTIPFAYGRLRGLIAPECECGANPPYCVVRDPKHGDLLDPGGMEP